MGTACAIPRFSKDLSAGTSRERERERESPLNILVWTWSFVGSRQVQTRECPAFHERALRNRAGHTHTAANLVCPRTLWLLCPKGGGQDTGGNHQWEHRGIPAVLHRLRQDFQTIHRSKRRPPNMCVSIQPPSEAIASTSLCPWPWTCSKRGFYVFFFREASVERWMLRFCSVLYNVYL